MAHPRRLTVLADGRRESFTRYGRSNEFVRLQAEYAAMRALSDVVYLVRVGDCIKIGMTSNLGNRLRVLPAKRTDILAVIPGGRDLELELLDRFAASLDHGQEWFRPTPDIIAFANEIRTAAGVPPFEF
jgi:hypothetical protein